MLSRTVFYKGNLYKQEMSNQSRKYYIIVLCIETTDSFDKEFFKGVIIKSDRKDALLGKVIDCEVYNFYKYNESVTIENYD